MCCVNLVLGFLGGLICVRLKMFDGSVVGFGSVVIIVGNLLFCDSIFLGLGDLSC